MAAGLGEPPCSTPVSMMQRYHTVMNLAKQAAHLSSQAPPSDYEALLSTLRSSITSLRLIDTAYAQAAPSSQCEVPVVLNPPPNRSRKRRTRDAGQGQSPSSRARPNVREQARPMPTSVADGVKIICSSGTYTVEEIDEMMAEWWPTLDDVDLMGLEDVEDLLQELVRNGELHVTLEGKYSKAIRPSPTSFSPGGASMADVAAMRNDHTPGVIGRPGEQTENRACAEGVVPATF